MPMIEFKLRCFKMQEDVFICAAIKFGDATFRKSPERFDGVDVVFAPYKWVLAVTNSVQ